MCENVFVCPCMCLGCVPARVYIACGDERFISVSPSDLSTLFFETGFLKRSRGLLTQLVWLASKPLETPVSASSLLALQGH